MTAALDPALADRASASRPARIADFSRAASFEVTRLGPRDLDALRALTERPPV
jgi:hypothetical protein